MKLLQNSKNCIRIQLSREDMELFSIRPEDFDSNSEKCREVIRTLCETIEGKTGFSLADDKLYIQLYPKTDGSCEIFFIRIEEENEMDFFLFRSFDHFYSALSYLDRRKDFCICYHTDENDLFLVKIPSEKVIPQFWEYGEKLKDAPSRGLIHSKFSRISSF